eukprot:8683252-Pyramimonas_sp.AAC.1
MSKASASATISTTSAAICDSFAASFWAEDRLAVTILHVRTFVVATLSGLTWLGRLAPPWRQ